MRKRALRKDFYMEIRKSLNRFISIMLIVALGVAFYSGIQSAAPDMRYSGDAYFDEHKLMDLKVIGTLGLTDRDVEALEAVEGIAKAEPGYMIDVLCGEETQQVLHVESISPTLNQLTVSEGRLPEKTGECFVDVEFLDKGGYEIGDSIVFYREDEDSFILKRDTFTIVGAGSSPLYISFNRGNTTLGTGEIAGAGYILAEDFDSDVYTQIYMEVSGARNLTAYTDAYDTLIERVMDRVEAIAGTQCELRYQEVVDEANEELADAKEELEEAESKLEDAKAEAESELEEAKEELEDGEKELEDAKKELEDAKKELEDAEKEVEDGENELAENETLLAEKEQELASGKAALADGQAKLQSGKSELAANEKTFNQEYAAGIKKIESGEKELASAKKELEDGWAQYNAGLAEYESSKADYEAGEAAYAQGLAQLQQQQAAWPAQKAALEAKEAELAQTQSQLEAGIADAQSQLAGVQQERTAAEAAVSSTAAKVTELQSQIETLAKEISALESQIEAAEDEAVKGELTSQRDAKRAEQEQISNSSLPAAQNEQAAAQETLSGLDTQIAALQASISQYTENLQNVTAGITQVTAGITQGEEQLAQANAELAASRQQLDAAKAQIEAAPQTLAASKKELEAAEKEIAKSEQELEAGRKELEEAQQKIVAAKKEIAANEQTLNNSQAQITSGEQQIADAKQQIADAKQQIADAKQEIEDGKQEIADGEKEIEENEKKLEDGWKEYEDGVKEYEEETADAEKEIADAKEEIADAEAEIAKIEKPEWVVSDRSSLPENIGYGENADRMRSLGQVFPVMFFLVAALISLTTMTRMVEEERTQIGTMKALGYGKAAIAGKYLCYALIATLCGCVAGILVGEKFLPFVIVTAYRIMYHHMPNLVLPYNLKFALIATGAALFSTMFATLSACYRELASTPAVLMRPPAPKEGKRVLLERLPFLWKHLSFSWKSTVRNLFRYKKRFFMTIFGIGGCMALMLVGYGLRDSIMDVASLQYTELQIYEGMVIMDSDAEEEEREALVQAVAEDSRIESSTQVLLQKDDVYNGKKMWNVYLMVPENVESIYDFINFRNRENREETYELTDEGAIITEKIAKLLGVKAGDTVLVENEDNGTAKIPIAAVTENYMSHYIYLTPALYEQCFGVKAEMNEILYRLKEENAAELTEVGEDFLEQDGALSISYTSTIMEQINDMLSALDAVMVVLIISAGLLAFIVLYNLNNININERKRELATIKVLGFYDGEVSAYVYRENILITIIGIGMGVVLGIILHRFVITTVEVDACMFGRNINLPSFLLASAFTAGFSIFVNVVMHFKLKKIDMVESLKSVE